MVGGGSLQRRFPEGGHKAKLFCIKQVKLLSTENIQSGNVVVGNDITKKPKLLMSGKYGCQPLKDRQKACCHEHG